LIGKEKKTVLMGF